MDANDETLYDEDEESEMEDVDEDGFPILKDPSEYIVEDLEEALTSDLDFKGTFAFSKTYDNAPNPALCLDGLGTVGLPLSERDAKAVIEKSIEGPLGKSKRTIRDTEVRDTWRVDASKVQFQEPKWQSFMDKLVREVCQALGVSVQTSRPRYELYELLVHGTGFHCLPNVDTEKTNGMFASIIVVLPSRFTGGNTHISHGPLENILDSSGPSSTKTTVLSWYTNVRHEIKPITSGYRLALSYNLLHATNTICPSLSTVGNGISTLRHILLSWKQQESEPDKIIYMLDYKYSQASLSTLKGQDVHIVAAFDSLSRELGFSLGFAHIDHRQTGSYGGGSRYGRRRRDEYAHDECGCEYCESCEDEDEYDEDEDVGDDSDDVEMDYVHDRSTTVKNLVDLDGQPISESVSYNELDTIPATFDEYFEHEDWDYQRYERYERDYGGTVHRFFQRCGLVIWPNWVRVGKEEGNRRTVYSLQHLRTLTGSEPSNEELGLFDYVCRSTLHRRDPRTLRTLCQLARQWKRVDLWRETTGTSQGEQLAVILPLEEVAAAVTQFGYSNISKELRDIILSDESVKSRLDYLTGLETWARTEEGIPSREFVLSSVNDMRIFTFDNLLLVDPSQLSFLTDEVMKHGGVQQLKKSVLPQLHKEPVRTDVLQSYATYLHTDIKRLAPDAVNQSLLKEIITEMLTCILEHLELFQVKTAPSSALYLQYRQPAATTLKGSPAMAMKFITQCLESDNPAIAIATLKRMMDMTGQTQDVAQARATAVLLPLIQLLSKDPKTKPYLPQLPLADISEVVIPLVLQSIEVQGGTFTQDTICAILDSLAICGTPELLMSVVLPKIRNFKWDETSWKLCMEQLYSRRKAFTTPESESGFPVKIIVAEMAKSYARKVSLPASHPTNSDSSFGIRNSQAATILAILYTCIKLGGRSALKAVLKRVLALNMTAQYIKNTLVPLLPGLCQLAQRVGKSVLSEPFMMATRTIMNNWVEVVLGAKPSEVATQPLLRRLERYKCKCWYCVQVCKFLTTPNMGQSITLDLICNASQNHVKQELQRHAYGAATYQATSHQRLTIKKDNVLFQSERWRATQQEGMKLLEKIGQEVVIRAIWGEDYTTFIHKMNGTPTSTPMASQNVGPHPTAGATGIAGPSRTQLHQETVKVVRRSHVPAPLVMRSRWGDYVAM
ncbi:hypothetical protein PM082_019519 [Marasmius tenuissimus]|nr:hypothetical protein PM082_019519 [Marasmius tenuissimus]